MSGMSQPRPIAAPPCAGPTPAPAAGRAPVGRRGFTLIEAMMVTVIVGVGVLGMLQLLAAGTVVNNDASELSKAVQLANNINEWTVRLPYDQLRTAGTYAGKTYSPPVDGRGVAMTGYEGWSQHVQVRYVNVENISSGVPISDAQVEPTSRVVVTVLRNGKAVHSATWLVAATEWP